jgi:hypothetical protein
VEALGSLVRRHGAACIVAFALYTKEGRRKKEKKKERENPSGVRTWEWDPFQPDRTEGRGYLWPLLTRRLVVVLACICIAAVVFICVWMDGHGSSFLLLGHEVPVYFLGLV